MTVRHSVLELGVIQDELIYIYVIAQLTESGSDECLLDVTSYEVCFRPKDWFEGYMKLSCHPSYSTPEQHHHVVLILRYLVPTIPNFMMQYKCLK